MLTCRYYLSLGVPIATDIGEAAHVRSFRGSTYILVYQRTPRQEAKVNHFMYSYLTETGILYTSL